MRVAFRFASRFALKAVSDPVSANLIQGLMLAVLFAPNAEAKTFTNSYISFELPEKWDCQLDQTEWVCRPVSPQEAQQAIIILTAKEVGPSDSIPAYLAHLKTPRQITTRAGTMAMSEILTVDEKKIADQPWVDGFHKSSEVPNYLTRYLATTKGRIAVLVTFSAHQLYYSKYSQDFLRAIGSLRVIAPKDLAKKTGGSGGDGPFGLATNPDLAGGDLPAEEQAGEGSRSALGSKTKSILVLAFVLAAVGIYLLIKSGRKKKR